MKTVHSLLTFAAVGLMTAATAAQAAGPNNCAGLPDNAKLASVLSAAIGNNGGFGLPMWATVVNRFGVVCAVASSGEVSDDAWLGSRAISAQKANTANAFSLKNLALSTANLFSAVQPGGSLYGLQHSNPVDPRVVYRGQPANYGTANDPMVGLKPGGINVFGGGLALYNGTTKMGAVGVSGDSSCADHNIAWRVRKALADDATLAITNTVPGGVRTVQVGTTTQPVATSGDGDDGIMYGAVAGFQHADCGFGEPAVTLPALD